ncbi:TetR family transcriptional regulator [Burkholderia cepacia]|uniref:TetR family transcriptional regulator n=1 Tax=Burkholderia cepacia TaxID=292 RepID=UPI002ABD3DD0|nr:TetR family transcriptional regulator [Burkholderia cepacia]
MATRKSAEARTKDFKLAILRIEQGKARTNPAGLSICAVAAEVGVSASLIHNHYPEVARLINSKQGSRRSAQVEREQSKLENERRKNADLLQQLADFSNRLTQLTTINQVLIDERDELKAKLQSRNIVDMPPKKR